MQTVLKTAEIPQARAQIGVAVMTAMVMKLFLLHLRQFSDSSSRVESRLLVEMFQLSVCQGSRGARVARSFTPR